ncbi:hypothetical protein UlMin_040068 [Ulmus minor]
MDVMMMERKTKKGLINKTWERCKSIGRGIKTNHSPETGAARAMKTKSKSWPRIKAPPQHKCVGPEKGCFSVYVGPEKQRFVVKTEYANHPLFKMLLEEAESEFGYDAQGPLVLPCNVDIFYKVLTEMEDDGAADDVKIYPGCGFAKRYGSYQLLSPSRMLAH